MRCALPNRVLTCGFNKRNLYFFLFFVFSFELNLGLNTDDDDWLAEDSKRGNKSKQNSCQFELRESSVTGV